MLLSAYNRACRNRDAESITHLFNEVVYQLTPFDCKTRCLGLADKFITETKTKGDPPVIPLRRALKWLAQSPKALDGDEVEKLMWFRTLTATELVDLSRVQSAHHKVLETKDRLHRLVEILQADTKSHLTIPEVRAL